MAIIKPELQPEILENEWVKIIPFREEHVEALIKVAADPAIWEQHPNPDRYKKEVFQLYVDCALASKTALLIYDKISGSLIGATRYYHYDEQASSLAIGYSFLAKAYWGGKYNKAVKDLLLQHAFQFVNKVVFHIGKTNLRSQQAVLKIGAKKRANFTYDFDGTEPPHYEYEIYKKEVV